MGQIDVIDVQFPLRGLSRQWGFQNPQEGQGTYTTPDCLNVRSIDPFQERLRGGSRPGLVQVLPPKSFEIDDEPENPVLGPYTYTPARDCHNLSDTDTNANGANLLCGLLAGRKTRHFILFDLTTGAVPVPAAAQIVSATLGLYGFNSVGSSWTGYVRKILRTGWTETGVTWTKYDGTNAWTTAGGDGDGTDITTTSPAQVAFTVEPGTSTKWMTISGLESIVQDAVTNVSRQLHIQIKKDAETVAGRWFSNSSECGIPSTLPTLTLTFTAT